MRASGLADHVSAEAPGKEIIVMSTVGLTLAASAGHRGMTALDLVPASNPSTPFGYDLVGAGITFALVAATVAAAVWVIRRIARSKDR